MDQELQYQLSGSLERIYAMYEDFTPSEKRVFDYIKKNLKEVHKLTISELAWRSNVSEATLTRFAQRCGFSGFAELRTAFIPDVLNWQRQRYQRVAIEELSPDDPTEEVVAKFEQRMNEALHHALITIDKDELDSVVDTVIKAKKIVLLGNGGSVYLAAGTALKLMKLGIGAISYLDYNGIQSSVLLLDKDDAVLAISHSGTTRETIDCLTLALGRGCTTIALTSRLRSPLAKMCDLKLIYGSIDFPLGQEAELGVSRIVQSGLLNLLVTLVAFRMNHY
jgi:DNA-binding MurR/RpiR family transcriptional regulator